MSLIEVIEAIRVLPPKDQKKIRELLEAMNPNPRFERFKKLRGSAKDDRFDPLELEDFETERRDVWKGLAE